MTGLPPPGVRLAMKERFSPNLVRTHHFVLRRCPKAAPHLIGARFSFTTRRTKLADRVTSIDFPNPNFQRAIRVSRRSVLERYYFIRAEPLKIQKSAFSSTPSRKQAYRLSASKRGSSGPPEADIEHHLFQVSESNRSRWPWSRAGFERFRLAAPAAAVT